MNRRQRLQPAAWLARAIAIGAVGAIVVLGLGIPGERGRYGRAVHDQRTDVTRLVPPAATTTRVGDRTLCARGVTGFASAAAAAYGAGLRDADGVIVPSALAAVSGAAIEADRWAEQGGGGGASPGPALPQRIGLDASGATVAPPEALCDGAMAFAQAEVSGRGLPAITAPPVKTVSTEPKAKPEKAKKKKKATAAKPKPTPKPPARAKKPTRTR